MKTIKTLLIAMILPFLVASCTTDVIVADTYPDTYVNNGISLPQLMEGYDLWYVDYDATTGSGDVPFLTRAFTISFLQGDLYANNNLAGIGTTGDGFGIRVGIMITFRMPFACIITCMERMIWTCINCLLIELNCMTADKIPPII